MYMYCDIRRSTVGAHSQKLQIFSAAFQLLIKQFRMYGPFLGSVKCEHDALVEGCESDCVAIEALKRKVATADEKLVVALAAERAAAKVEQDKLSAVLRGPRMRWRTP